MIRQVNASVKRIAIQPVVRTAVRVLTDVHCGVDSRARLSSRPRNLFDLWTEYELGLEGHHNAARSFTAKERGIKNVKYIFSLRNSFWTVVDVMGRAGHASDVAIDKIYSVYGRGQPVTDILRTMRKDKKRYIGGVHPSLH